MAKMRDRAHVSSLVGWTRPELLYCKIGVFMAAASDKTDHVWKRRGCTEIENRERGGEGRRRREEKKNSVRRYGANTGGGVGGEGKHEMETQWDAAAEDKGKEVAAAAASHGVSITAGQPKLTESTLTPF